MRRAVAIAFTAAVLAGAGMRNANAETAGTLTFGPPAGQDITPMSAFTSGLCPGGTNLQMKVFGKGFAQGAGVTGNTAQSIYPRTPDGGFEVPFPNTMRVIADDQNPPVVLEGKYTFVVTCRDKLAPTSYGTFTGSLEFTSPTTYTSIVPRPGGSSAATAPTASSSAPSVAPPTLAPQATATANAAPPPVVSTAAATPAKGKGGSSLPAVLTGLAAVVLLVGAVAMGIRKSGRKQAFIRP